MKFELKTSNLNGMTNMPDAESDLFEPFESSAETDTEKVDTPVATQATGTSTTQVWIPCLPSSLSAQTLFDLALTVEAPDPARQVLGFFYEPRLKRECELLIPHPIPSYYLIGIRNALMIRRSNSGFFICNSIDVVLTYYLNYIFPEDNNDVF